MTALLLALVCFVTGFLIRWLYDGWRYSRVWPRMDRRQLERYATVAGVPLFPGESTRRLRGRILARMQGGRR